MPITDFPFLCLAPDNRPRPWLPVKITNPHTGLSMATYGLIDTGADECTMPAYIAAQLGHDLKKGKPKKIATAGGQSITYSHTTQIEIYDIRTNKVVYVIPDTPIDFSEGLPCVLLGVRNFLDRFTLKVDYKNKTFSVNHP